MPKLKMQNFDKYYMVYFKSEQNTICQMPLH